MYKLDWKEQDPLQVTNWEDYSNSPDEKLRRPEKARNEGTREKEGERLEVGRADTEVIWT